MSRQPASTAGWLATTPTVRPFRRAKPAGQPGVQQCAPCTAGSSQAAGLANAWFKGLVHQRAGAPAGTQYNRGAHL